MFENILGSITVGLRKIAGSVLLVMALAVAGAGTFLFLDVRSEGEEIRKQLDRVELRTKSAETALFDLQNRKRELPELYDTAWKDCFKGKFDAAYGGTDNQDACDQWPDLEIELSTIDEDIRDEEGNTASLQRQTTSLENELEDLRPLILTYPITAAVVGVGMLGGSLALLIPGRERLETSGVD